MNALQLQLDLDFPSSTAPDGEMRHTRAYEGHQRGLVIVEWDMAAHPNPGHAAPAVGDLLPAWVCCLCGQPELTRRHLEDRHGCAYACEFCAEGDEYHRDGPRLQCHGIPHDHPWVLHLAEEA